MYYHKLQHMNIAWGLWVYGYMSGVCVYTGWLATLVWLPGYALSLPLPVFCTLCHPPHSKNNLFSRSLCNIATGSGLHA